MSDPHLWQFGLILRHLPYLLAGAKMTLAVSAVSILCALAIGVGIALARMSRSRSAEFLAGLFIDVWRSTPTLAQLLWVFYALPILTGVALDPFTAGVITLGCHYGASLAETFRAGILSLPAGQRQAALALGMTRAQALRRIILPQAVVRMLPAVVSMFIVITKESALVSMINLRDLMWHAQSLAGLTMRSTEVLTIAAGLYAVCTYPQALLVNYLHRRLTAHA
ncbi:MAG TPA: amino acid ABC transporter permease [Candidatus Baltobacteraceae bacterium]|nr:amino acid ABC transporter permease [Candidatus Baltobacteraceae bacterium]